MYILLESNNCSWRELSTSGYVISSLYSAFWALNNCDNLEDGIIKVVNRGDDSDTCGAIAGALLGAYYGQDCIPIRWLDKIKRKDEIIKMYNTIDSNKDNE